MFTASDHTFALCAYGISPYLEECLTSLEAQTLRSRIILCTSTPNERIEALANAHGIELHVNEGEGGIAQDWNYAVETAGTPLVTIAHQDDVYEPLYAEAMLAAVNGSVRPLLFFTNYGELRDGAKVDENRLLSVKRRLLRPLEDGSRRSSVRTRRRILSFGSAICCPSVTLVMRNLSTPVFRIGMKSNLDWEAWEAISRKEGDFLYDPRILMYHRIHEGSETSALIEDDTRTEEDLAMLKRFWPTPVAQLINLAYARGQKSNG